MYPVSRQWLDNFTHGFAAKNNPVQEFTKIWRVLPSFVEMSYIEPIRFCSRCSARYRPAYNHKILQGARKRWSLILHPYCPYELQRNWLNFEHKQSTNCIESSLLVCGINNIFRILNFFNQPSRPWSVRQVLQDMLRGNQDLKVQHEKT